MEAVADSPRVVRYIGERGEEELDDMALEEGEESFLSRNTLTVFLGLRREGSWTDPGCSARTVSSSSSSL